ncbi:MAG: efflux RND transporter periplasmic adaptor subunit [Candidatus Schekmanbacteria bacterium]|nr:efflux RND transporter periplasmic adaptor subunit [Candidatus Schekmanbacteria bacterium]
MIRIRSFRLALLALLISAGVSAALSCSSSGGGGHEHAAGATTQYHCPMHPTYLSDHPGDCPICGMRLVPVENKAAPAAAARYTCPMHPNVTSDVPGRCPQCGMALVVREPQEAPAAPPTPQPQSPQQPGVASPASPAERKILHYRNPMDPRVTSPVPAKDSMGMDYVPVYEETGAAAPAAEIPGLAAVTASAEGLRQAGVRVAVAEHQRLARRVRTVGTVMADETRVRHVHTKISGWIDKLFVNFTGQTVKKGEPILALYSQELLAGQQEYLQALEISRNLAGSDVQWGSAQMVEAARRRLELFDVPASFLVELERTRTPQRTVTLLAPAGGFVTAKPIYEGEQVEPGTELFTVTDLSHVWVQAAIYENEAPFVRVGQTATLSIPYDPRVRLSAPIAFVDPSLSLETRTLRVRFEFENRELTLRPGMFLDVALDIEPQEGVVVPDAAILDTGVRKVVYVDNGAGTFTPREVQVGLRVDGRALVLSGLVAGEKVAAKGNFLLDSEARIRGAFAAASRAPAAAAKTPAAAPGHQH